MNTIEKLAATTRDALPAPAEGVFEIISIAVIIEIIQTILSLYSCFALHPASALESCNKPSIFNRISLQRMTIRKLGWLHGARMAQALVVMGKTVSEADIRGAVSEHHASLS